MINSYSQFSVNGLFQKKTKWGIEDILSWKPPLEFLGFLFYPWKFQKKQSFTPETPQNCVTPLGTFKVQNQVPWKFHMTFFFLVTPENCKLFLINPWKFHHQLPPPPCSFFSGIAHGQVLRWSTYLGIFCWYRICSSQVLDFQMLFYQEKLSF